MSSFVQEGPVPLYFDQLYQSSQQIHGRYSVGIRPSLTWQIKGRYSGCGQWKNDHYGFSMRGPDIGQPARLVHVAVFGTRLTRADNWP